MPLAVGQWSIPAAPLGVYAWAGLSALFDLPSCLFFLDRVLVYPDLFLDLRALLDHDLLFGHRHPHLVFTDLGLGGLPALFDRHPLYVHFLAPLGYPELLAVGPHPLADADAASLTLADASPKLLFGPLHSELVLVPEVILGLGYAFGCGVVLAELPALSIDVTHRDARVPLARRLVGRGAIRAMPTHSA